MALRKDKIQALKDSLCLDNVDPATRSALNNLVDNLMDLFGDVAFPELGELPGIDAGEFGFPEDAPFDFPTGGGGMPAFDPLGGFEGGPPGGGDEFGPGGEGGEGGQGGGGCLLVNSERQHHTFFAKTKTKISAADENGNPGTGTVDLMVVEEMNAAQKKECEEKCQEKHKKDLEEALEVLRNIRFATEDELPSSGWDHPDLGGSRSAAMNKQQKIVASIRELLAGCEAECEGEPNPEGPQETEYTDIVVQNISCEEIEADVFVVVSGEIMVDVYELPGGESCGEELIQGTENLYVVVEACGCD